MLEDAGKEALSAELQATKNRLDELKQTGKQVVQQISGQMRLRHEMQAQVVALQGSLDFQRVESQFARDSLKEKVKQLEAQLATANCETLHLASEASDLMERNASLAEDKRIAEDLIAKTVSEHRVVLEELVEQTQAQAAELATVRADVGAAQDREEASIEELREQLPRMMEQYIGVGNPD